MDLPGKNSKKQNKYKGAENTGSDPVFHKTQWMQSSVNVSPRGRRSGRGWERQAASESVTGRERKCELRSQGRRKKEREEKRGDEKKKQVTWCFRSVEFITELKLKDKNKRKMEIKQEMYKSDRDTRVS